MQRNITTTLGFVSCLVLFSLLVGSAGAAQLRYIRIGEHKGFTRIVFEFHGAVAFEDPVTNRGQISVIFPHTTTTLPADIGVETTNRVDNIRFMQQNSTLAAVVRLPCAQFRIKSLSLSDPERVVLDVYPLRDSPQRPVKEPVQTEFSAKTLAETNEKKVMVSRKRPSAHELAKDPDRRIQDSKPLREDVQGDSKRLPWQTAKESAALSEGPPTDTAEEEVNSIAVLAKELVPPIGGKSYLQTYLLVILLAISLAIGGLLGFLILHEKRRSHTSLSHEMLNEEPNTDENIGTIDARIKEEFQKLDKF